MVYHDSFSAFSSGKYRSPCMPQAGKPADNINKDKKTKVFIAFKYTTFVENRLLLQYSILNETLFSKNFKNRW